MNLEIKHLGLTELIELYKEFRTHWFETQPVQDFGGGHTGRLKPTSYDFMEWLVQKSEDN